MSFNINSITLEIIVKSKMPGGHCYLGYDRENKCIVRPIKLIQQTDSGGYKPAPVDTDLKVGKSYKFRYKQRQQRYLTQLPHKNEDLAVDHVELDVDATLIKMLSSLKAMISKIQFNVNVEFDDEEKSIKDCLKEIAKHTLVTDRFVLENDDRSSVQVFITEPLKLEIYRTHKGKKRIKIRQESLPIIDLPYTATETPHLKNDRSVIVVMSMSRPYAGTGQNPFNPRRCYVLVVGLIQ